MIISLFDSDKDPRARRKEFTWDEFVEEFQTHRPGNVPKSKLPMWSPATFRDDYRCIENVEGVSLLVYDVDEEPIPSLDDIAKSLKGLVWFAHSSSSSLRDAPRWRLVVLLSRPLTAEEYPIAWRAFAGGLGFPVGAQSKDPSRAWYAARAGADGTYLTGRSL